ncbi:class I adenylate-forming enzyme family protein [Caballeronia sp. LZ032]|uniref:class I adenylate-forming enzyme family protein n=1 Tax=Caballeronia sp. LZ032 TaxID=3038565 RepID=UPI0028664B15|nr:class I adenylate-forming enzyme family protein [Caballeronia sp. LZ032]MDR5881812.1 class I adenylate-forming enzyme family protein [Caballeronia sp. LZ032]
MTTQSPTVEDELVRRKRQEQLALPESLGQFVREQAALYGGKTAAVWFERGVSMTYAELDRAASQLADALVRRGVRKGCHVALMLKNAPEFPVTWIALGRIGAVMVPVNTAYTRDEMRFVLDDADVQYLVIDEEYVPRLEGFDALPGLLAWERVIVSGAYGARADLLQWQTLLASGRADFAAPAHVSRDDLLNLQYTSGTTGFPKGCMLSHDYWMIHCHGAARHRRGADAGIENVLIWAPFFYMDPLWQFLMTLKLGGTAYIAERMSLTRFMSWLIDYRIHYCIFPEPALSQHPRGPGDAAVCLKYISIYGWTRPAREEVQARFGVIAREGFGMTEVGTGALVPAWAGEQALERTCGLPAPFRELQIRREDGSPAQVDEVGELWIRGRGILWGYYKRPEANAESFDGDWFRTGDLFRRDADGFYYIVGRIKEMIKRAGENVSATEVETVLRSMDAIDEAAVVPVPDPLRREEVKAYLKLREGFTRAEVTPAAVFEHCARHLAAFKVPRYLQYMEGDFPRTPSRKIAKKRLIAETADPFVNTYDRQEARWR